jgi:hypothetical protein
VQQRQGQPNAQHTPSQSLTQVVTMSDQQHTPALPNCIIEVDRELTSDQLAELRSHVAAHGLVDLPFGARVSTPR